MFWQRWQCYILCWGKPRHSVPSLWASALTTCSFDTSRSIKHTRSINKFICTKWEPQHNKQNHDLHFTVQHPPPAFTYRDCISQSPWCSHACCVSTGGITKQSSYLMASLLLYAPVSSFYRKKKKKKHLTFVCTICCLGTESNVYKTKKTQG